METDSYLTVEGRGEGLYKEKGSKFLAIALPVQDEEEIKERLEEIRKAYYDARHHCYAWVLTPEGSHYRANDDGEPNHSAGDPILGQIRSLNLTNTLIVVVRYFGGTKLGVSGLIQAYRAAAAEALQQLTIVEKVVRKELQLTYGYEQTSELMRTLADFDAEMGNQQFTEQCQMQLWVRVSQLAAARQAFQDIEGVTVD